MSGSELTLGAVLAHLEEQEREIAAQAEATRGRIAELTAQLEEFDRVAEEVRITRKTLLALPDPSPPTPPAAKLPNHPAYRQIMAVFAAADAPLRARAAAGQVHEHDVPGGAFDQGAERRRRPCRCLCGAFADHDHGGGEPRLALLGLAAGHAHRTAGARAAGNLAVQFPASLDVEGLADRFVGHALSGRSGNAGLVVAPNVTRT